MYQIIKRICFFFLKLQQNISTLIVCVVTASWCSVWQTLLPNLESSNVSIDSRLQIVSFRKVNRSGGRMQEDKRGLPVKGLLQ